MIISLVLVGLAYIRHGLPPLPGSPWLNLTPILGILGIAISTYLGYIEVTGERAVCGFVGDCNAVQSSPYAQLFGIIPVGILGAVGYILIIALWALRRRYPLAHRLLPFVLLASVAFSIYLTFLEPFVFGAICMWCMLSALTITALLWLYHPNLGKNSPADYNP